MTGTKAPSRLPIPPLELAFRVGITGARQLEADAIPRIRARIEEVLRFVKLALSDLGAEDQLRPIYAPASGAPIRPRLRALTALADGADRIFADIADHLGYEVDVALPFDRSEYAKDFDAASRADFDRRLDAEDARPYLALDGGRGDEEDRSYEAVGRIVVRNCDLLIAVWDGRPAKGRGGTADIVRFATKYGPPVWWIDVSGAAPARLIRSAVDLRRREGAMQGKDASAALAASIEAAVVPPTSVKHRPHSIIGMLTHGIRLKASAFDWLRTYFDERVRSQRWIWRTYGSFTALFGGKPKRPAVARQKAPTVAIEPSFWTRHFEPADQASIAYGDRYRSSYVLVFALAAVAVVSTILSLVWSAVQAPATILECTCLFGIAALVILNQWRDWQGRWISYRLIAELCRKQGALSLLGWSLPASDLRRFGVGAAPAPWVGWYFDALLRSAPLAVGHLAGKRLAEVREIIRAELISSQASYHASRRRVNAKVARRLALLSEIAFLATCLIVMGKLLLEAYHATHVWIATFGAAAAILPALSAAFVGLRAYSEGELLEQQSQRLMTVMEEGDRRVGSLDLDRPLASQDLAADVYELSSQMLQDVNGWADLFVIKVVEAG